MISFFPRKNFRFNYQLLWSEQDQPAFAAFHNHFTADECVPFIISKQNEHPYFFKPDKVTQQTMDLVSFDPRLITENDFHDDNRPYRYEQNIQEQQNLFTNNDNNNEEDDKNNEEYILEDENENRIEYIVPHTNENNTSEYTTPESTTSAQNASQTEISSTSQFVRIPTRVVSQRQNTHDPQSYLDTSSYRNITFNLPTHSDEVVQDESQNITSTRDTSVNVLSHTMTISNNTRNTTRFIFQQSNKTIQSENNRNNNQQTSSQHYNPFNYSFFPPPNTIIKANNTQKISQPNNNLRIQHPYAHLIQTNSSQSKFPLRNQRTFYSNLIQTPERRSRTPPLSHISTDPLYQMNQNTTYNPTTISPPVNMIPPVAPSPQYIPIQQDTFINTSASIPEPMKPFDSLDHSYTPEEYLQQVEANLTFAIGEEPQNNPTKYRSRHNRRMAYIQCSLLGTALDWYTNLHISYKQQWNSFVQLFKKQFSSQKTANYAQVEVMSLMKKDTETVRRFALRVQQLVKKGWCNESASTINLENNEIFTKGLPKNLKDFAHR